MNEPVSTLPRVRMVEGQILFEQTCRASREWDHKADALLADVRAEQARLREVRS